MEILREYFGTVSAATLKDNFDVVYQVCPCIPYFLSMPLNTLYSHSQLLEETLDSGGHPLTTSPNALRDIVLPPSLISKLLSNLSAPGEYPYTTTALHHIALRCCLNLLECVAERPPGAGVIGPAAGAGAFASPIPWRKAGLRYNNNDIYFDVVEELRSIVNK